MLIRHIGHAEFLLESEGGFRLVTDPYDATCGYPLKPLQADAALVSHYHHDHDAVDQISGSPRIIDQPGSYTLESDVRVTAVKGFHDDVQGAKRGETLLFAIEMDGLKLVHLGDLGTGLTQEQIDTLKCPDVLMIPVGGFFTIDGDQAAAIAEKLEARVLLPMHYKTAFNADWPITGPEVFLAHFGEKDICQNAEALRVTAKDLECQPRVMLFRQG